MTTNPYQHLIDAEATGGIVQVTGPAGAGIVDPYEPDPTPTVTGLTGAAIAEGLRELATAFEQGVFDSRSIPNQAVGILMGLASEAAVREVADWFGVDVDPDGGSTSAEIPFGFGIEGELWPVAEYACAVLLRVYHIAEVTR